MNEKVNVQAKREIINILASGAAIIGIDIFRRFDDILFCVLIAGDLKEQVAALESSSLAYLKLH